LSQFEFLDYYAAVLAVLAPNRLDGYVASMIMLEGDKRVMLRACDYESGIDRRAADFRHEAEFF
jgi:hypothetical protein